MKRKNLGTWSIPDKYMKTLCKAFSKEPSPVFTEKYCSDCRRRLLKEISDSAAVCVIAGFQYEKRKD